MNTFFSIGSLSHLDVSVLAQCVLERDLELFDAGDSTEVGEKGITLRFGAFSNFFFR